jgi:hypothetical protein
MRISEETTKSASASASALSFVVGAGDVRDLVNEHYSLEPPPVHFAAALLGFVPGSIGGKIDSSFCSIRVFMLSESFGWFRSWEAMVPNVLTALKQMLH